MSKQTKKFKTEVQELLNLVISSLYSNRDIFLRELVSNSSDAIDKLRFEAFQNKDLLPTTPEWKIKIFADKDAKTLKIVDNGIGMSSEDLENNLGTIAKSGTKAFMEKLQENKDNTELIGQFGVGFYSAFMAADKISVLTKKAGEDTAWIWESDGTEEYTLEETSKDEQGTEITLHLKDDAENYLEEYELRQIIKKYSNYLEYPVNMDIVRTEKPRDEEGNEIEGADEETIITEETLNDQKALWTRSKNDISDEEYEEFYKHISHDWNKPLETIHYNAEGAQEFKSILFLPEKAPMDLYQPNDQAGIHLYVKRIFIMDDCKKLLPEYLRFVKGIVDSSDLPLNVSREILQEDKLISKIEKALTKKVLDTLKVMKKKDLEKYEKFYAEFGKVLKEGLHSDFTNKDKLLELVLFESTNTDAGKLTSLKDYTERMPEDQKDIYFITGSSRTAVENSPHLEAFRKKGYEVLFLVDPIDEWIVQSVTEYDSKPLKSVTKGDIDLDDQTEEEKKKEQEEFKTPLEAMQKVLDENVKEVRFSNRLTDSPACLVADEHAMGANMERIFAAMNQEVPVQKRILELNKDHDLIKIVLDKATADSADLGEYAELLYDQALLTEGSPVVDPAKFAKRITDLMLSKAQA